MKKIQVSTVKQTADVEVIFINANLIKKVLKAEAVINKIVGYAEEREAIHPMLTEDKDENGEIIRDDEGKTTFHEVIDDNGNKVMMYESYYRIEPEDLRGLYEEVKPFLNELSEAFDV